MSNIETLKITPTCFDHQLIIIRDFLSSLKSLVKILSLQVWLCGSIRSLVLHVVLCGEACRRMLPHNHTLKLKFYQ
jgi:hypothetical protein